jgi:MscS family membrane protein
MDTAVEFFSEHSWVVEVFVIVLATAIARYIVKIAFNRLAAKLEQTNNLYDDALLEAARKPLGVSIWVLGISAAAELVGGTTQAEIFESVDDMRDVAVVALLIWFALRFITFVEEHVVLADYKESTVDPTTARAVAKLLRATVLITGVLLTLQALGFSISGVLAFGGIGGLAIGLAAQDLLANFFGGLMIFMDRPFAVGDWIRSPDREIEGTVEEIGWRLTRIRTFDKRPLYIPNSVFLKLTVENPSRMHNRRIHETFGLRYDDVGSLAAVVSEVEQMLRNHEAIDTGQTLMVNVVEFEAYSVNFFVYCFTKTTVWTEFHVIKQDVLLKIADIVAAQGTEFAFPTQTLLVDPEPSTSGR